MTQTTQPTAYIYAPLRVELYAELVRRSGRADVSAFIDHCVESFLADTVGDPDIWSAEYAERWTDEEDTAFHERYGEPGRGYQWGTVFLPNGTKIRMSYGGQNFHAEVRHGGLLFEDERMSPSQFARRVANNTNRNAWRDLYIQFPGRASWELADVLRQRSVKAVTLSDF